MVNDLKKDEDLFGLMSSLGMDTDISALPSAWYWKATVSEGIMGLKQ
ncbi:MAG: hypothetical protein R2874_07915 [Desulfobacterales bacterium]